MGLQGCDVILSFHLVLPYHDAEILVRPCSIQFP